MPSEYRRSKLGFFVFACGLFGLANAIFMIWYTNGVDYPLVIGGKPLFAWEFSIPVMFELTVLLSLWRGVRDVVSERSAEVLSPDV